MLFAHLTTFVGGCSLSLLLTWLVRNIANRNGWVQPPNRERHVHVTAIPRLGGVAIFLSFLTVSGLIVAAPHLLGIGSPIPTPSIVSILLAASLVFLIGLYDDACSVSPYAKIAVQCLAGLLLFRAGLGIFQLPLFFGSHQFGSVAMLLTILWVVTITNAFNLIDGVDGLATGSALFSLITVMIVSLVGANYLVSLLSVGLAGALLGFLRFNYNPATIFLGDSGSLFVGFMLSALSLSGTQTQKSSTFVAIAIPIVCFGLPVLDTTLAVVRRFLNGRSLFSADGEHIHHKLLQRGFSQRQVVVILYAVSALFALLSLLLLSPIGKVIGIALMVVGAGLCLGVQHLRYPELVELMSAAQRAMGGRQTIIHDLAIRRATNSMTKVRDFAELRQELIEAVGTSGFDRFKLILDNVQPENNSDSELTTAPSGRSLHYMWTRTSSSRVTEREVMPGWELTLEFVTPISQRRGQLSLHQAYSDRPLQVDVHLLTSGFRVVLVDAIDRITRNSLLPTNKQPEPAIHHPPTSRSEFGEEQRKS